MPATPSLRQAKIIMILSLVSMTLLLLRKSWISLHQSLNFVLFPSNYPGSGTILFSMVICTLFIVASTSATDITLSNHSVVLSKALFVIYKNPSFSDNASILFICLELILVLLIIYATYVLFIN